MALSPVSKIAVIWLLWAEVFEQLHPIPRAVFIGILWVTIISDI